LIAAVVTEPSGSAVTACDPDNYYGQTPKLAIVKKTNGTDNNVAPGVYVVPGSTVTWTYEITNTGNVALTNLALSLALGLGAVASGWAVAAAF